MDSQTLKVIGCVVLIAVGVFALDQLGLWLERRGWLYWRKKSGSGSGVGNALLGMQSVFEPDKRHVHEVQVKRPAAQREAEDGGGARPSGPATPPD